MNFTTIGNAKKLTGLSYLGGEKTLKRVENSFRTNRDNRENGEIKRKITEKNKKI